MKLLTLLPLLFCALPARAENTLRFSAQVEDESLAEDSLLLVHCLAERANVPWEFTDDAHGPLWLRVSQDGKTLRAVYHKDNADHPVTVKPGESDTACDALEKSPGTPQALTTLAPPAPAAQANPAGLGSLGTAPLEMDEPRSGKTWIWVAAGAAVVGGLLLWRSHQPTYNSVEMR